MRHLRRAPHADQMKESDDTNLTKSSLFQPHCCGFILHVRVTVLSLFSYLSVVRHSSCVCCRVRAFEAERLCSPAAHSELDFLTGNIFENSKNGWRFVIVRVVLTLTSTLINNNKPNSRAYMLLRS